MNFLSKMDTYHLHNGDMKKIVRILQREPFLTSGSKEAYQKLNEDIHNLPRHLRSFSVTISSTNLCSMHKGLNTQLINDIWAWLRYELDGGIELRIRQLEPVRQMWHKDFKLETSAPPGCEPICGLHWQYQHDQCPACMLARIGSNADVLFAIFAGMVGRMTSKASGTEEWQGPMTFERVRSKRLRFIRYWIKATSGGNTAVYQAGELGVTMKHLTQALKAEQLRVRSTQILFGDTNGHDPKLGPLPRPSDVSPLSPIAPLGFNINTSRFSDCSSNAPSEQSQLHTPRGLSHSKSYVTVWPEDSISWVERRSPIPVMAEAVRHESESHSDLKPPTHFRVDSVLSAQPKVLQRSASAARSNRASVLSVASSNTITSYDGGVNVSSHASYSPYDILTQQELLDKYRGKLAKHGDDYEAQEVYISALQVPRSSSMYSSFSDKTFEEDPYEATDKFSEDDTEATDKEILDWEVGEADEDGLEVTLSQILEASEWQPRCSPVSTTWGGLS